MQTGDIIILSFFVLLMIWTVTWKIISVWSAARHGHKGWFIALLFINSLGILDLWYIFKVAKVPGKTMKEFFKRPVSSVFKSHPPVVGNFADTHEQ